MQCRELGVLAHQASIPAVPSFPLRGFYQLKWPPRGKRGCASTATPSSCWGTSVALPNSCVSWSTPLQTTSRRNTSELTSQCWTRLRKTLAHYIISCPHRATNPFHLEARRDGERTGCGGADRRGFHQQFHPKPLSWALGPHRTPITSSPGDRWERRVRWLWGQCRQVKLNLGAADFSVDLLLLPIYGVDLVLGLQWLSSLGPVVFDYRNLLMELGYQGTRIRLNGLTQPALNYVSPSTLAKEGVSKYRH